MQIKTQNLASIPQPLRSCRRMKKRRCRRGGRGRGRGHYSCAERIEEAWLLVDGSGQGDRSPWVVEKSTQGNWRALQVPCHCAAAGNELGRKTFKPAERLRILVSQPVTCKLLPALFLSTKYSNYSRSPWNLAQTTWDSAQFIGRRGNEDE